MRCGLASAWAFGRLEGIPTTSSVDVWPNCWGQSFTYDRYANLTGISVTQCSAPALGLSINGANNRVWNYGYDASGHVLNDGNMAYTWNRGPQHILMCWGGSAEGRMATAGAWTYNYDGDNRRVYKSSGKLYWYGAGGEVLAELDSQFHLTEYIYFNGMRIARRDPDTGNVYYYLADCRGSARLADDRDCEERAISDEEVR